jgi:hypothetical protein
MRYLALAVLGSLVLLPSVALAGTDYATVLPGKWEGDVQATRGGALRTPDRTLIIESVEKREGGWTIAFPGMRAERPQDNPIRLKKVE